MSVVIALGICIALMWLVLRVPHDEMESFLAPLGPYMVLIWIVIVLGGGILGLIVLVSNG